MMPKEVEIDKKKVGEESLVTIKLTIKNLIIVLAFIVSTVTGAYFALKSDINGVKKDISESRTETKKDIDRIKEEDLKVIYNQVNQIDGKVQTILMLKNDNSRDKLPETELPNLNPSH